ncbi:hypothetical protein RV995_28450 (plasmid) [Sinorhizobium meliloti]
MTEFEIRKTVEMAVGLQPDARQGVVIAGSAEFDKAWVAAAQEDLIGLPSDIETTISPDCPSRSLSSAWQLFRQTQLSSS